MKKIYIAALAMGLIAASCGNKAENAENAAAPDSTVAKTEIKAAEAFAPTTNIRYIDLDSVLTNYNLAKELSQQSQKMMLDYQNLERQKGSELQKMGNDIQQKVNSSGYLSQESYQADVNSFNRKQTEAQNFLASRQNQISNNMAAQQQRLNDSIQSFIRDYNATRHYDAILYKEAGVFFNPALDITAEVVAGLNARYKSAAPAEEKK